MPRGPPPSSPAPSHARLCHDLQGRSHPRDVSRQLGASQGVFLAPTPKEGKAPPKPTLIATLSPPPAAPQDPPEQRDCRPHRRSSMGQCNCRKKRKDSQELTDVERAIETVINQFHCYAVKGQKEYLTPNEMRELVVQKLPHLGKCVGPLDEKIECMGDPDEAKLEFGEYWDMMGDAAKGCRRK
ncbi:protein S100-A14 isoform X1 [Tympanuchus pallidicinctus]|uniref:protein S100-A14 isoform X1 n=1 Tax=Tympanuchus pallidicinctus TaxID=109042 RepID=UPI002287188D|nr:protein S100-A14 isoform X1 [Tympanuchus pallidicinctus]